MNKQAQDKLWNELSEESKNKIKEMVSDNLIKGHYLIEDFKKLFGTHNLNLEPSKPKTWEDVVKENPKYFKKQNAPNPMLLSTNELRDKLAKKVLAMYKIAILIESGYGGMVSEEEWENCEFRKYGIISRGYNQELFIKDVWQEKCFITFHTRQQAEEFMSYPENRKLVEQYYMM